MDNFVEAIRLQPLLSTNGIEYAHKNFESLYSSVLSNQQNFALVREIESRIASYFEVDPIYGTTFPGFLVGFSAVPFS